jgi:hypothetical protein
MLNLKYLDISTFELNSSLNYSDIFLSTDNIDICISNISKFNISVNNICFQSFVILSDGSHSQNCSIKNESIINQTHCTCDFLKLTNKMCVSDCNKGSEYFKPNSNNCINNCKNNKLYLLEENKTCIEICPSLFYDENNNEYYCKEYCINYEIIDSSTNMKKCIPIKT